MPDGTDDSEVSETGDLKLNSLLEAVGIKRGDQLQARLNIQQAMRDTIYRIAGSAFHIRQENQADVITLLIENHEAYGISMNVEDAQAALNTIIGAQSGQAPPQPAQTDYEDSSPVPNPAPPSSPTPPASGSRPSPITGFLAPFGTPPSGAQGSPSASVLGSSAGKPAGSAMPVPGTDPWADKSGTTAPSDRGAAGQEGNAPEELTDLVATSQLDEEFERKVNGLSKLYSAEELIQTASNLVESQDYSTAHTNLEAALRADRELAESNKEFHLLSGVCYEQLGRDEDAIVSYRSALALEDDKFAKSRLAELTGEEQEQPSSYDSQFENRFTPLGLDLQSSEALAAKEAYIQVIRLMYEGETEELNDYGAVELLNSMPPQFNVEFEKGLLGKVQFAKYKIFQASQLKGDDAGVQNLHLQAVELLRGVLELEPKFKEADTLLEQYTAHLPTEE